jgi:hypothetical protein
MSVCVFLLLFWLGFDRFDLQKRLVIRRNYEIVNHNSFPNRVLRRR